MIQFGLAVCEVHRGGDISFYMATLLSLSDNDLKIYRFIFPPLIVFSDSSRP